MWHDVEILAMRIKGLHKLSPNMFNFGSEYVIYWTGYAVVALSIFEKECQAYCGYLYIIIYIKIHIEYLSKTQDDRKPTPSYSSKD